MSLIKTKFAHAKITGLVGKSSHLVAEMSQLFDEVIPVDRVQMRDSKWYWSVKEIIKLVANIRRRKFDFVIDLHSLYETNILGYLSGAKLRLFASRGNRSLDRLSNFRPKPPPVDHSLSVTESYLNVLKPLEIRDLESTFKIRPHNDELRFVDQLLKADKIADKLLVGINIGAGHPSRFWGIDNFAKLAALFGTHDNLQVLVFFGPEELHLKSEINAKMPASAIVYDDLNLKQLAAICSRLKVLIGSDTGPLHLAAAIGTSVMFVSDPLTFYPPSGNVHIAVEETHAPVDVHEVYSKTKKLIEETGNDEGI